MKFDWNNWNIGGKVIFVAGCVAIVSMLMKWVDIGIASQSGLSQGAFLFLGFWLYPVIMIFKNKSIHRVWGLVCSIASVICSLGYISSKSLDLFGETVNATASGAYLFLFASIALIIRVIKYQPVISVENNAEQIDQKQEISAIDQIEKLAALKKRGAITEEEFQIKKKYLLGL